MVLWFVMVVVIGMFFVLILFKSLIILIIFDKFDVNFLVFWLEKCNFDRLVIWCIFFLEIFMSFFYFCIIFVLR